MDGVCFIILSGCLSFIANFYYIYIFSPQSIRGPLTTDKGCLSFNPFI